MQHLSGSVEKSALTLVEHGARPVIDGFAVAESGQQEVVIQGRRYFIAPNDDQFKNYLTIMSEANVRHLVPDTELSSADIVVVEVPRDARRLSQLMRSHQPDSSYNLKSVFHQLGERVRLLESEAGCSPKIGSMTLNRVLVLRNEADIVLTPNVGFETATDESSQDIVNGLTLELLPAYAKFGSQILLTQFVQGLHNES